MAVITTGNHPKAMWPGVKAWWGRSYDEHKKEYPDLFDMGGSSEKNYEEDVEVTGFGLAPVKNQGAPIQFDSEAQGTINRYTHVAYGLGYIVTREERDDNQYEIVSKRRTQALAFSMNQTKETVAANHYNRAFSSSYVFGDGVEMISSAHPTISGNQSNILATAADLSEAALEDMIIQIMGATNSKGHKIALMPKSIVVPRQLWFVANRILRSTLQTDTANNNINVIKATSAIPDGIKINHYLTDADAWFVRTNCPNGLKGYQRTAIEFTQDNDGDTQNAKAKAYERYVFGVTDWRGIYGTAGA